MSEPDNLVLELLRGMRAEMHGMRDEMRAVREDIRDIRTDIRGMKVVQDSHTLQFGYLDEKVDMLRESTMTALGFANHVDLQQKKMGKQLAALSERVEKLEKSK
jgi:uncharacterized protein (UPF0335 family)